MVSRETRQEAHTRLDRKHRFWQEGAMEGTRHVVLHVRRRLWMHLERQSKVG